MARVPPSRESRETWGMTTELDAAKAEAFGGRMMGVLNGAMLAIMGSIGHETGLFDTMATLPPSTSAEVARREGALAVDS